ncbi:hypothetical protein [Flavobacterium branchiicola]|uniref:Lipoprotein n=1 Tax=Flavobacterium branchiicola TaxID=1114875 RepID=A0ABV9PBB8_9FLAO|nr:hypothetical protein [Flavobacterium branchiicola]MBS7253943.1 hypothetical protein [Flavobacterium branchiicola]
MHYKKLLSIIIVLFISFSLQSCLVSRCKRPQIVGYIYDADSKMPIENCKVGEVLSQQNGYFLLTEKRYHQFTFFGYEAPPLSVFEVIEKEGYQSQQIQLMNTYGGGTKKGALHNADTLYLKKVSNKIEIK